MDYTFEIVIFFLLLVDAIGANVYSWLGKDKWWKKHFRVFTRWVPRSRAWTGLYLALVLWIGYLLYRFGAFN